MALTSAGKKHWTENSELDKVLFELTGVDAARFFGLMRLESDPWAAIEEVLDCVKVNTEIDEDEAEDFIERCEEFLAVLDSALTSDERAKRDPEAEMELEPKWDTRYSGRQFRQDVWGINEVVFVKDYNSESRKQWRRTVGDEANKGMRLLTEWGNFSFDITKKNHQSMLRVRTSTRQGVPFLGVGGIQINMNTGLAQCYVSGCKFRGQLRINPAPCVYKEDYFDKEYAEFQVLKMLQHLGEHTLKNPKNYWTPIMEVSKYRDTEAMKLVSNWNVSAMQCASHKH